jgi:hypothetical protein
MDRSEEFRKIVRIYQHTGSDLKNVIEDTRQENQQELSTFMQVALRVSLSVRSNDTLVSRINKLSCRKEFSNDPSIELGEVSAAFGGKVMLIKQDLQLLRTLSEQTKYNVSIIKIILNYVYYFVIFDI